MTIHVALLLDESGSMGPLREDVVGGVDVFVGKMQGKKNSDKTRVSLYAFDRSGAEPLVRPLFEKVPLDSVKSRCAKAYAPRGATPLNDAVIWTVDRVRKAAKKGDKVLVVVYTDGRENASEAPSSAVAAAVRRAERRGWEFVYLGANQDAWVVAGGYGLAKRGQTFSTQASPRGMSAQMATAGAVSANYMMSEGVITDSVKRMGGDIGEEELDVGGGE